MGAEWNLLHFALPEGTLHFAIRNIGRNGEGIMVDDLKYFGTPVFTPEGYNIYRNGTRINTELVTDLHYTDTDLQESTAYRYAVAAVVGGQEMAKSDELLLETSGIDSVGADGSAVSINNVEGGIEILGATGFPVAVYSIDGKCVTSLTAADRQFVALTPGAYIVSAGSARMKVMVR